MRPLPNSHTWAPQSSRGLWARPRCPSLRQEPRPRTRRPGGPGTPQTLPRPAPVPPWSSRPASGSSVSTAALEPRGVSGTRCDMFSAAPRPQRGGPWEARRSRPGPATPPWGRSVGNGSAATPSPRHRAHPREPPPSGPRCSRGPGRRVALETHRRKHSAALATRGGSDATPAAGAGGNVPSGAGARGGGAGPGRARRGQGRVG